LDLKQIEYFVRVAELGSFTRAASLLNLSQPALTVQIRNLEEALGVRLFDRNTRTVSLTRMGRELVPALQRIVRDLDAVVAEARDLAAQRHGIVRLAALPSFAGRPAGDYRPVPGGKPKNLICDPRRDCERSHCPGP
jgi:DNA-binding transcriptional LysR family regulator